MPVARHRGLTLVEVVVAVAILAVATSTAAVVFAQGSRVQAVSRQDEAARLGVENEIERLRGLSFWSGRADAANAAGSLVEAAFPHATVSRNTDECYYVESSSVGEPSGAFVTTRVSGGHLVRTVAQFAVSSRDGWRVMDSAEVGGFSCHEAASPPGTALLVTVSVCDASPLPSAPIYEDRVALIALTGYLDAHTRAADGRAWGR